MYRKATTEEQRYKDYMTTLKSPQKAELFKAKIEK